MKRIFLFLLLLLFLLTFEKVPVNDSIFFGDSTAKIHIIEYSNFQCVYCYYFHQKVYDYLFQEISDGNIFYEFVHVDIEKLPFGKYIYERIQKIDSFASIKEIFNSRPLWIRCEDVCQLYNYLDLNEKVLRKNSKKKNDFGILTVPTIEINGKIYSTSLSLKELQKIISLIKDFYEKKTENNDNFFDYYTYDWMRLRNETR